MDNSSASGRPVDNLGMAWGVPRSLVFLAAAATVGAAVIATLYSESGDRVGALLFWFVATLMALATAYGSLLNPRLTADGSGVVVRGLTGTREAPWEKVEARVQVTRRFGRDGRTLELELAGGRDDQRLVVLGKLELGSDPDDVLAALNRLRP